MIRFLDGPAAGESLNLRRAPVMLRVVQAEEAGEVDALDQLDDVARPNESIYVYRLASVPTRRFIDFRDKQGRRRGESFINVDYRLFAEQPPDDVLRDNEKWAAWCDRLQKAEQAAAAAGGGE